MSEPTVKYEDVMLQWRTHTPNLLKEVSNCSGAGIFKIPIKLLLRQLDEVATRASELNDPKLNALMCKLTLYACADPEDPNYDLELLNKVLDDEPK